MIIAIVEINAQSQHEYAVLTKERVSAALAETGGKAEVILAEGSLMGLGWYVLHGNDKAGADLSYKLAEVVTNIYNGTDKMDVIYMKHTSMGYGEMLNLNRFDDAMPICPSTEYKELTLERVNAAFAEGADYKTFKLAEGSLVALGWFTAYGRNDAAATLGDKLMNKAYKLWPNSNEAYFMQSSTAYSEIINLGRFKLDKAETKTDEVDAEIVERFKDNKNGTVLDNTTGLVWLRNQEALSTMTWDNATAFVTTLKEGTSIGDETLNDGSFAGDWRLPTNEEWTAMFKELDDSNGEDIFSVKEMDIIRFWSSTPPTNEHGAYYLNTTSTKKVNFDFDGRGKLLNIWAVRNTK